MNLLLEADELFNIIFKITYYDDPEFAVCNTNLADLSTGSNQNVPLEHDKLLELIET